MPNSKLVHYASESNLNLESELSKEDSGEAIKELKSFKTLIAGLIKEAPPETISAPPPNHTEPELEQPNPVEPASQVPVEPQSATSRVGELLQNSLRESRGQPPLPGSAPTPAASKERLNPVPAAPALLAQPTAAGSRSFKSFPNNLPGSLGSFIEKVPATQRRNWESASVIMKRIMDDKTSVAPTSEMSANTRALVFKGKFGLWWNDWTYDYLPCFVA